MTTLALSQIRDPDCVVSFRPLRLGLPRGRYVTGADAVVRRVLYAWLSRRGSLSWARDRGATLLALRNADLDRKQLVFWASSLAGEGRRTDYVLDCRVKLELVDRRLSILGAIDLVDRTESPLEVSIGDAGAALLALGSANGGTT